MEKRETGKRIERVFYLRLIAGEYLYDTINGRLFLLGRFGVCMYDIPDTTFGIPFVGNFGLILLHLKYIVILTIHTIPS